MWEVLRRLSIFAVLLFGFNFGGHSCKGQQTRSEPSLSDPQALISTMNNDPWFSSKLRENYNFSVQDTEVKSYYNTDQRLLDVYVRVNRDFTKKGFINSQNKLKCKE
jgi:hypothetical protein